MADAYRTGLSAVEPISMSDATGMLGAGRAQQDKNPESAPQEDASAPDEPESREPPADDGPAQDDPPQGEGEENAAAGEDQPPGEENEQTTEEADPADELPPVEPPRSWTKAEKEAFAALPRAHQESLLAREQTRERDIRKRQDDVVAVAKAVQAKEAEAEQAKVRYETGINQLSEQLNAFIAGQFQDVKTWDDVQKMAVENPVRYNEWKVATDRAQALQAERTRIASENQRKQFEAFQNFDRQETARFLEAAPEFADPKQGPQLVAEVNAMLTGDYGVSEQDLAALWGGTPVSILDHRFRLILRDALAYKKTKAALKPKPNPNPKPASPPPQRPGTPPAKGEVANRTLEKANTELSRTGSRAAALDLMRARRRA